MKLSTFPILAVLALSLTGCGKFFDRFSRLGSKDFTVLSVTADRSGQRSGVIGFQDPIHSLVNVLNGGAIIYAKNTGSGEVYSLSVAHENVTPDQKVLIVPKGNYEFFGVGWEQSGLATSPTTTARLRCGIGPAKSLSTDSDSVVINLADLNACHDNPFFTPAIAKETSTDSTILPLTLIFCDKADLSDRTADSDPNTSKCQGDIASSYFFKGDANYTKMDRAEYFSSSGDLMFSASRYHNKPSPPSDPYFLYRYDMITETQTKVQFGATITGGAYGVKAIKRVPYHQKLVYTIDRGGVPQELWIYNLDTGVNKKISGPNSGTNGVKEFRVSDDGGYVVYVADAATTGIYELFSIPITADTSDTYAAPTAIGGSFAVGNGVKNNGCSCERSFEFEINPNSNMVVFAADKLTANKYELFIATLNGAAMGAGTIPGSTAPFASGTKISGAEIAAAGDFGDNLKFTYDGAHVYYHVSASTVNKLYALDLSYDGTTVTVSNPVAIVTANASHPYVLPGTSTDMAVFFKNDGTDLFVGSFDVLDPASTTWTLFTLPLGSPGGISQAKLIAGDTKVIVAAHDGSRAVELRSALVNVSADFDGGSAPNGTSVSYTAGILPASKQVNPISSEDSGSVNGKRFVVNQAETRLLFIADIATETQFDLQYATIGTPAPVVASGTLVNNPAKSISGAAFHGNDIYFTYDPAGGSAQKLYKAVVGDYDNPLDQGSASYFSKVSDIGTHDDDDMPSTGFPVMGQPVGAPGTALEAWLFEPGATPTYSRFVHLVGDANGAGRAQVVMMQEPAPGQLSAAISSACLALNPGDYDGAQISTSVRIPAGNGSTSPFYTVVRVFPHATSCSGTPGEEFHFPKGIYQSFVDTRLVGGTPPFYNLFLDD